MQFLLADVDDIVGRLCETASVGLLKYFFFFNLADSMVVVQTPDFFFVVADIAVVMPMPRAAAEERDGATVPSRDQHGAGIVEKGEGVRLETQWQLASANTQAAMRRAQQCHELEGLLRTAMPGDTETPLSELRNKLLFLTTRVQHGRGGRKISRKGEVLEEWD